MVERPIKKSERQAASPSSDVGEQPKRKERPIEEPLDSKSRESFQRKDRSKGRGKRHQQDSGTTPVNPALMRGPKPTKPKPPVLLETQEPAIEDEPASTPTTSTAVE